MRQAPRKQYPVACTTTDMDLLLRTNSGHLNQHSACLSALHCGFGSFHVVEGTAGNGIGDESHGQIRRYNYYSPVALK